MQLVQIDSSTALIPNH